MCQSQTKTVNKGLGKIGKRQVAPRVTGRRSKCGTYKSNGRGLASFHKATGITSNFLIHFNSFMYGVCFRWRPGEKFDLCCTKNVGDRRKRFLSIHQTLLTRDLFDANLNAGHVLVQSSLHGEIYWRDLKQTLMKKEARFIILGKLKLSLHRGRISPILISEHDLADSGCIRKMTSLTEAVSERWPRWQSHPSLTNIHLDQVGLSDSNPPSFRPYLFSFVPNVGRLTIIKIFMSAV